MNIYIKGCLLMALTFVFTPFIEAKNSFPAGGEVRQFTLTGYYSPLPNQPYFLTGSYESEIRLNGHGKNAADGTAVYPGMIAAPKDYQFGTSVCLPNFGCGKVHDRGGAIVKAGERNLARHDRLDLWMGYGEEGLRRALALGVKHVTGRIYHDKTVPVSVNFSVPSTIDTLIKAGEYPTFNQNLKQGNSGKRVVELKSNLAYLGFETNDSNLFDARTKQAIIEFQLKNYVIPHAQSQGAGVFGPKTRSKMSEVLYKKRVQEKITKLWNEFQFKNEMKKGKRSEDVVRLQQLLVQKEFLQVAPTGYFGAKTEQALKQFQLSEGLIRSVNQTGAGVFGPKTRARVNKILTQKKALFEQERASVLAYTKRNETLFVLAD